VDGTPDYRSTSLRDLEDVARNIDREAFPDRWAAVREELRRRANEPRPQRTPQPWHRLVAALQALGAVNFVFVLASESGLARLIVVVLLLLEVVATFELWWGLRRGFMLSLVLQAMQIISVSIGTFTFVIRNGLLIYVTARFGNADPFDGTAGFGTDLAVHFSRVTQQSISVNLIALVATLILVQGIRSRPKMWKISVI